MAMREEKAKITMVEKDERLFLKAKAGRKWKGKREKEKLREIQRRSWPWVRLVVL